MKRVSMKVAMEQYHIKGLSVARAASLCKVSVPYMLKELKRANLYEPRLKVPPPGLEEIEDAARKVKADWTVDERKKRWVGNWS